MAVEVAADESQGLAETPGLTDDERLALEEDEELGRASEEVPAEDDAPVGEPETGDASVEEPSEDEDPVDAKTLRDQLAETRAELAYIRGALSSKQGQPETAAQQMEEPDLDVEKLIPRLRTDPVGVIREIAETIAAKTERRILAGTQRMSAYERAMATDRDQTETIFGDAGRDPEIVAIRDKLLADVKKEIGNLYPGSVMMATATAESIVRRQRERTAGGNGKAKAVAEPARLPVRKPADGVRGTRPATGSKDPNAPLRFEDLSAEDKRGVQLFVSRSGGRVTIEKYMSRMNQRRKENPEYGTGR